MVLVRPPGSGSISQRYGSGSGSGYGSFLFPVNVLSGLKRITSNYPVLYNAEQKPNQYLKFSSLTVRSAASGSGTEADEISVSFKT